MRALQNSVSTAIRYSAARNRFPTVITIVLATVLASSLLVLITDYYDYATLYPYMGSIPLPGTGNFSALVIVGLFWLFILSYIYFTLNSAYTSSKGISWENSLSEGILGILRIIEHEDWEDILFHLRRAKQGFLVLSIFQFITYWVLASILLWLFYGFIIQGIFGVAQNIFIVLPFSAIFVLILGDHSIRKSYNELWFMDGLITELRWFYLEFQGSGI